MFSSSFKPGIVIDQYPSLPIRAQFGESSFNEFHKKLFIIGHDGEYLGEILLNGLSTTAKNYIRNIIAENYQEEVLLGDINGDTFINVQDVVLVVNLVFCKRSNARSRLAFLPPVAEYFLIFISYPLLMYLIR